MASKLSGVPHIRKLLRRMPEDVTKEVKQEVRTSAMNVLAGVKAASPHESIAENMSVDISPDGLTAKIGLIGKRANKKGFLARFFEFGTKAHLIKSKGIQLTTSGRRKKKGGKNVGSNFLASKSAGKFFGKVVKHKGTPKRPFFFKPIIRQRPAIIARIKAAIARAVEQASGG